MEYLQSKWKLDDLYPEDYKAAFDADLKELNQKVESFEKYRGELTSDITPARFLEILKDYQDIAEISWKMGGFTSLRASGDTQNTAILSLMQQTDAVTTELQNRIMFFDIWFRSLDDEKQLS